MSGPSTWIRASLAPLMIWLLIAVTAIPCSAQKDYYPDHPEVQEMVFQAIEYLKTQNFPNPGEQVLGALTIVEASKRYDSVVPVNDPIVADTVSKVVEAVDSGALQHTDSVYYPALALILLCDAGDEKYKDQINAIIKELVDRQEPSGAYTYKARAGRDRGDTSQTQYVALALWVAYKHGFQMPIDTPRKALEWLLDVHLPSGAWYYSYNGRRSGHSGEITLSIQAASSGTVYLLSDFLQLNPRARRAEKKPPADGSLAVAIDSGLALPPSVSVYVPPKDSNGFEAIAKTDGPLVRFDVGRLNAVKRSANLYLTDNFTIDVRTWGYYYLYALERYAFFREKAEGSVREVPDWYDRGVRLLKERQRPDGGFRPPAKENNITATCFAILFLVRSSEVLILPGGEGGLTGGQGLKPDVQIRLTGTKVKSFDVVRGLDDVLDLLGSDDIDQEQFELVQDALTKSITQLSSNKGKSRREHLNYMRGLVSDRNYFRRLIAVKLLSRQQEMDNVPALIYALGDPDVRVSAEAHNGLRLISRRLDAITVDEDAGLVEYQQAKRLWTEWFLKIRPGAELLD